MANDKVSVADLREKFTYDPETGIFRIIKGSGPRRAGEQVGGRGAAGYLSLSINGHVILAHRAAWAMMTGHWPKDVIDHINGTTSDNRWENLREASHAENIRNAKLSKANTSGYKGVSWFKKNSRWKASIVVNYKTIHLGYFSTREDAAGAYANAAEREHGDFFRKIA